MACKKFRAPANLKFDMKEMTNVPMDDWTFLGMASIMDPPRYFPIVIENKRKYSRDTTASAIQACKEAGIKVYMVTGDHKSTATAIAKQIGMIDAEKTISTGKDRLTHSQRSESDWAVITGPELGALSTKQWDTLLLHRCIVFAR